MTRFTGTRILIPDMFDTMDMYKCLCSWLCVRETVKGDLKMRVRLKGPSMATSAFRPKFELLVVKP